MTPFVPRARVKQLAIAATVAVLALAAMLGHASVWRASDASKHAARRQLARVCGADLALSSSSRWLRHPSISEPGAPFTDGPATLDGDPAGALIAPGRAR